ncbi:MAG: hypothetical protein ACOCZE_11540, partial [Planctomycetota bacterium]
MTQSAFDILRDARPIRQACTALQNQRRLVLNGLWGSAAAAVAAAVARTTGRCVVLVTRHLDEADDAADDIQSLSPLRPRILPAWEVDQASDQMTDEIAAQRIRLANDLSTSPGKRDEPADLIVAPVMALLQPLPDPDSLARAQLQLARGEVHDPDALAAWLVDHGYQQVDQVEQQGDFARRGGILDLLAVGTSAPVRMEFFGDEIDSIRRIDLDTQRSVEQLDGIAITSAAAGMETSAQAPATLADYLPQDAIIFWNEYEEIHELAGQMHQRAAQLDYQAGTALQPPQRIFAALEPFAWVRAAAFGPDSEKAIDLEMRSLQKLSTNTHEAMAEMGELAEHATVWVQCENTAQAERFNQLLEQKHPELLGRLHTADGGISGGFHFPAGKLVVAAHHEVFHRHSRLRRIRRVRAGRPLESLLDLNPGDHVVH